MYRQKADMWVNGAAVFVCTLFLLLLLVVVVVIVVFLLRSSVIVQVPQEPCLSREADVPRRLMADQSGSALSLLLFLFLLL